MSVGMKRWIGAALLAATVAAAAWAADANGKWTWTQKRGQNDVAMTLELKQDGDKVTGTLGAGERKTEIKEGAIKDNEVTFVIVRNRNGQESRTTYKGKIDGDKITGTTTSKDQNGQDRTREWVATRVK